MCLKMYVAKIFSVRVLMNISSNGTIDRTLTSSNLLLIILYTGTYMPQMTFIVRSYSFTIV